jgi:hypothetical protein
MQGSAEADCATCILNTTPSVLSAASLNSTDANNQLKGAQKARLDLLA